MTPKRRIRESFVRPSTMASVGGEIVPVEPGVGRLIAEGRALKPGRHLVVVAADVRAEDAGQRRHVAALQGTMIPVSP